MERLNSPFSRFKMRLHNLFVDHEILRMMFRNFYPLSNNAYRSNHPSASFIKMLQDKYAVKTIISMRKADKSSSYLLEKEACEKHGITLINHRMSSRKLPKKEMVIKAKQLLNEVQYPILIHCKSGADRAGLMSVFYKHFVENEPLEIAVKQLSMKFGHFRWADTGKLDFFFDEFFAYQSKNPEIKFIDWVEHVYDPEALDKEFKSAGWANIVDNKILRRE